MVIGVGALLADEWFEEVGVAAAFGERWLMWSSRVKRLFAPPGPLPTGVVRPVFAPATLSWGEGTKPFERGTVPPKASWWAWGPKPPPALMVRRRCSASDAKPPSRGWN